MISKLNLTFDKKQLNVIKSWHNVSIKEDFSYVKFFSNWVSFNAICYALFHHEAVRERVDIDNFKKLPEIKSRLRSNQSISLEEGQISATERNIKLKLKFPEKLDFTIKQRFTEHFIFNKFSERFQDVIIFNNDDNDLISLKKSLKKNNGRFYVIDMARYEDYDEKNDVDIMSSKGIITLLENNDLSTIIDVLYQIRCNIFHGGKEPGDNHDDIIVKSSNPILNRIVEFIIYENPEERLNRIKDIIKYKHDIPKSEVLWASGGLIITYNNYSKYASNHNDHYPFDVVVRTKFCKEISWFIYEIREIYKNKFHGSIPSFLYDTLSSFEENNDIYNLFSNLLNKCEDFDYFINK